MPQDEWKPGQRRQRLNGEVFRLIEPANVPGTPGGWLVRLEGVNDHRPPCIRFDDLETLLLVGDPQ
jgi:hypothetical protein